jgi:hypothetical protein
VKRGLYLQRLLGVASLLICVVGTASSGPSLTAGARRDPSGQPGPRYWQQRANYRLNASLNDETHRLRGTGLINYTNNSPLPLDVLWLHLDMATHEKDSRFLLLDETARSNAKQQYPDLEITSVRLTQEGETYEADYSVQDTRMLVIPKHPLAPEGGRISIHLEWSHNILPYGERSGRIDLEQGGSIYAVGQWYPRMAVFDDVHGWNTLPFVSPGEFYASFGDFEVQIDLPRRFIVAGPGRLENEEDVLSKQQLKRLNKARHSSRSVYVITPEEAMQRASSQGRESTQTWIFTARNVRDFAWTASDRYAWDASSVEDTLVMAYYPSEAIGSPLEPGFEKANEWTRHAVSFYSGWVTDYPYPVAITAAVLDPVGMEYPMMNFSGISTRGVRLFGRIDHEISHTWFPMLVGTNERRHAWMDEGLATFINYYSHVDLHGRAVDLNRSFRSPDSMALRIADVGGSIMDLPIEMQGDEYSFLSYDKAGYGLFLLREYILEPKLFDAAFRAYVQRWKFKHPYPEDFFRTIEDVSGESLDWFWEHWFYGNGIIDQAIEKVLVSDGGRGSDIYLRDDGPLRMPVRLLITYENGRVESTHLPVEIWREGSRYAYHVDEHDLIRRVELDPNGYLPDINRRNNVWESFVR